MSQYALRAPRPEDAAAVATFQTMVWNDAYATLVPREYLERTTAEVRRRRWQERIEAGQRRIMLAEQADEDGSGLIGVASAGAKDGGLELMTLYVARSHWGTGVAAALLQAVIGDAAAHLWVFEANPRAIAFYGKHGFTPDGTGKIDPDTGLPEIQLTRG
ncbi:Protein N-acetyltransferase, RimJ/RimL family [Frankineae bacterium MT45]|nr:Protein N-acetyltransferase, RimJ/RimL family [Frankineae bacterium MT45]